MKTELDTKQQQGHPHAELMAQYAEDAKTSVEPWEFWELKRERGAWTCLRSHPSWIADALYRRKPKMKIVHGVWVPDISFVPKYGERHYYADPICPDFCMEDSASALHLAENGLCYPYTEEGKQAAILHAKAMLGIE